MVKIYKSKKILFVLCFLIIAFLLIIFFNTSQIQKGYIYYEVAGECYKYNVLTKTKRKVEIDGYDSVNQLYITDDGYYVCASKNGRMGSEQYPVEYFVYNGEILFNSLDLSCKRFYDFYKYNDSFFFLYESDNKTGATLIKYNLMTKQFTEIIGNIKYGYTIVENYICFCDVNISSPNVENNIYALNMNDESLKTVLIGKGSICNNASQNLVYEKDGDYFIYDFEHMESSKANSDCLKYDSLNKQYLCSFCIENTNMDVYLREKVIYDKETFKNDEEYYTFLKQGKIDSNIQLFRHICIDDNNMGKIIIPIFENRSKINLLAIEYNGKLYYPNHPFSLK